jgi:hypothetical protein
MLALGQELKKTLDEILLMNQEEFNYWIAYFKVKADKEKLEYGRSATKYKT